MAKPTTKIQPAPVAFPNGGGLKAMARGIGKRQQLERQLVELQNQLNLMKLGERHVKENKPDAPKTKKAISRPATGN